MSLDRSVSDYVTVNGCLIAKLRRAFLYRCVQSSKLWNEKLCNVLTNDGYISNPYDACVFNKTYDDGEQVTVAFHVDDLLITSRSVKANV